MSLKIQSDLFEQKQSELKKHFEDYRKWCFSATKNPKVQPQKLQPPTCFPCNDSFFVHTGVKESSEGNIAKNTRPELLIIKLVEMCH